jgi:hypothetical protein
MKAFLDTTINDIRSGRDSWRVYLALCMPSFGVAIAAGLARQIF